MSGLDAAWNWVKSATTLANAAKVGQALQGIGTVAAGAAAAKTAFSSAKPFVIGEGPSQQAPALPTKEELPAVTPMPDVDSQAVTNVQRKKIAQRVKAGGRQSTYLSSNKNSNNKLG
jgi:hypothetical protein